MLTPSNYTKVSTGKYIWKEKENERGSCKWVFSPYPEEKIQQVKDLVFPLDPPFDLDQLVQETIWHSAYRTQKILKCSCCGRYIDPDKAQKTALAKNYNWNVKNSKGEWGPQFTDGYVCDCGANIVVRGVSKSTNFSRHFQTMTVGFIQSIPGSIMYRRFHITVKINPETKQEEYACDEYLRYTIRGNKAFYCSTQYQDNTAGYVWDMRKKNGTLCPNHSVNLKPNFDRLIADNPKLKFTRIFDYLSELKPVYFGETELESMFYKLVNAAKNPWIEFLWKKGGRLYLYSDVINGVGNGNFIRPKLIMKLRKQIAEHDLGSRQIELYRRLQIKGYQDPPMNVITALDKYSYFDTQGIVEVLESVGDFRKSVNYLSRQCEQKPFSYHDFLHYYPDYLRMLKQRNQGVTDLPDNLLYPKNFKTAHDKLMAEIEVEENKERAAKLDKTIKKIQRLEYQNDGFGLAIVVPQQLSDILYEGATLKHCVGSNQHYVDEMIEGKSVIVFLRSLEDLSKPLVTVQLRGKKIEQRRGYGNREDKIPANTDEFLNRWIKDVVTKQDYRQPTQQTLASAAA